jgi:short-subunit dehydrogenase
VNNVGSAPARPGGFLSVTDAQWRQTVDLNLFAAVAVTRAVLPGMLEAGRGSVVNIGSVNAGLPDPTVVDYSAAKAALVKFSRARPDMTRACQLYGWNPSSVAGCEDRLG